MKKQYWFILFTYIAMQFLAYIGVPLFVSLWLAIGKSTAEAQQLAVPSWIVFSFTATLIVVLFFLRSEIRHPSSIRSANAASPLTSFFWAVGGVFLALFAQAIAVQIELTIGIEAGSKNTEAILQIIELYPIVLLVTSIVGPILEEIVFRKIIFGELHKRFNFIISALVSSLIFAAAHNEFEHILLYTAMGFTFAYLYVRTKRIIVPIFAHVAMNTFVVLVQSVFYEDIQKMIEEVDTIQCIFGGF